MVYEATNTAPFKNDQGLREQIQWAVVSVMSNIAEGFMCQSNRGFTTFLGYSLRSTAEVQSQLYAALDLHYISDNQFRSLTAQCSKVAKMLQGFIRYLRTSKPSTSKPSTNKPSTKRVLHAI
jgi:four helix bundle protein